MEKEVYPKQENQQNLFYIDAVNRQSKISLDIEDLQKKLNLLKVREQLLSNEDRETMADLENKITGLKIELNEAEEEAKRIVQ
jgi:hypothetical protein